MREKVYAIMYDKFFHDGHFERGFYDTIFADRSAAEKKLAELNEKRSYALDEDGERIHYMWCAYPFEFYEESE